MSVGMGNPPEVKTEVNGAPPTPPPAAAPQVPVVSTGAAADPDWLHERLERAKKSALKEALGIGDAKEVKDRLARLGELEKQAEEAKKAQMSEVERLKAEAAELLKARDAAVERADMVEHQARIYQLLANQGVKNLDYGFWAINAQWQKQAEGEELDERAFLDTLLKDPTQRAACGIVDAAPATPPAVKGAPATTTPAIGAPPQPPAPNGAPQVPGKTAMEWSPDELATYKSRHGLL